MIRGLHGSDIARKIVGDAAPADDGPDDQAPEGDEQNPRVDAARQALDALHDDDADGWADALGVLVDLHSAAPQADAKPALKVALGRKVAT